MNPSYYRLFRAPAFKQTKRQISKLNTLSWGNFGSIHAYLAPKHVTLPGVKKISCGYDHMMYIDQKNNIGMFGKNACGQLAIDPEEESIIKEPIQLLSEQFATEEEYKLIKQDIPQDLIDPDHIKFSEVFCGRQFTFLLSLDRKKLFAVGNNDSGQLGLGVRHKIFHKVIQVKLPTEGEIENVYCAYHHNFVTMCNGDVYVFGMNNYGCLGTGEDFNEIKPRHLPDLSGIVKQISASATHSAFLLKDGNLLTTGRGIDGQLGLEPDVKVVYSPKQVKCPDDSGFDHISCGVAHTLAISKLGNVYSWGKGLTLDTRQGEDERPDETDAELLLNIPNYKSSDKTILRSGAYFSVLYHPSLGVMAHGVGQDGQLGNGERNGLFGFQSVANQPSNLEIEQIECGFNYVFATSPNWS
ncbi:ultraviolet-B receptor UVR8 [Acrasis kona]|uniref:Ultraviolet-B receptor UVR8 n=1 Tax=Acrasis kona TaxID=1008807 RepID=A0AAW2ZL26_9EUKA